MSYEDERLRKVQRDYDELLGWVQDERVMLQDRMSSELEYMHEIYERGGDKPMKKTNHALFPVFLLGIGLGGASTFFYEKRKRMVILEGMEKRVDIIKTMTKDERLKMQNTIVSEFLQNENYSQKEKQRWRKILSEIIKCQIEDSK